MRVFISLVGFLFILMGGLGCELTPPPGSSIPDLGKLLDKNKKLECRKIGSDECDEECQQICDNLFSRTTQGDCYEHSKELVEEFNNILENLNNGRVKTLSSPALQCLLDLDKRKFVSSIRYLSSTAGGELLSKIAKDSELADTLQSEDDDFKILKTLLTSTTGSNDLTDILKKKMVEDQTFLWAVADKNKPAFQWLEGYVEDYCSKPQNACPLVDEIGNLGAYCKALIRDSDLNQFLSSADLFKQQYQQKVEQAQYEYLVSDQNYMWHEKLKGDFKDFCRVSAIVTKGEREWLTSPVLAEYFNEGAFKAMLSPVTGEDKEANKAWLNILHKTHQQSAPVVATPSARTTFTNAPFGAVLAPTDAFGESNFIMWDDPTGSLYGNIHGGDKLKGVGGAFWLLNSQNQIMNHFFNVRFDLYIKSLKVLAPQDPPDDPKTNTVQRAFVVYYVPSYAINSAEYPYCHSNISKVESASIGTSRANTDGCPYFYCLLNYALDPDGQAVKMSQPIKCALEEPLSQSVPAPVLPAGSLSTQEEAEPLSFDHQP